MIALTYKPKRMRGGKRVVGRLYRGKYRLGGESRIHDVALGVCDKQVAEQKLAAIVRDCEKVKFGLIPAQSVRASLQKPLTEHVRDFAADLTAQGRNSRHIRQVQNAVLKLAAEADWKSVQNVTADSFQMWRAGQSKAAKTLNEYLGACVALLNWMVRNGRVSANPLVTVRKVETRGKETLIRRAYTAEEIERLLAAAGPQRPVYAMAVLTGIRHNELKGLRWGDVDLISETPSVAVRSSISKNHKTASLPLHPDLVAELVALKPAGATSGDLVFNGLVPRSKRFNAHLTAAGIPKRDAQGQVADFHSLRHTFCTSLHCSGASEREAQELMRHSDPRLTAGTYTDTKRLGLRAAVGKLSLKASQGDSQIDLQKIGGGGRFVSLPVANGSLQDPHETLVNTGGKSLPVTHCHIVSMNGGMVRAAGFEPAKNGRLPGEHRF